MKRYAVYKNGRLVTCYSRYVDAMMCAYYCKGSYCFVHVIDMEDGAICYYWSY